METQINNTKRWEASQEKTRPLTPEEGRIAIQIMERMNREAQARRDKAEAARLLEEYESSRRSLRPLFLSLLSPEQIDLLFGAAFERKYRQAMVVPHG